MRHNRMRFQGGMEHGFGHEGRGFGRGARAGQCFGRGRSPELRQSMGRLREAVAKRLAQGNVTEEQIGNIIKAIDGAAKAIGEVPATDVK